MSEDVQVPETRWYTRSNVTTVTGPIGNTLGWVRTENTPAGPRWFAMRYDGAYATPAEGRLRHREAAEDFMEALRRGEIE
jgi:hypothetical protein